MQTCTKTHHNKWQSILCKDRTPFTHYCMCADSSQQLYFYGRQRTTSPFTFKSYNDSWCSFTVCSSMTQPSIWPLPHRANAPITMHQVCGITSGHHLCINKKTPSTKHTGKYMYLQCTVHTPHAHTQFMQWLADELCNSNNLQCIREWKRLCTILAKHKHKNSRTF